MKKKALSLALALVMCLGLTVPASATSLIMGSEKSKEISISGCTRVGRVILEESGGNRSATLYNAYVGKIIGLSDDWDDESKWDIKRVVQGTDGIFRVDETYQGAPVLGNNKSYTIPVAIFEAGTEGNWLVGPADKSYKGVILHITRTNRDDYPLIQPPANIENSVTVSLDSYVEVTHMLACEESYVNNTFYYNMTCMAPVEVSTMVDMLAFSASSSKGDLLQAQKREEYENPGYNVPLTRPGAKFVLSEPGVYYVTGAVQQSPTSRPYNLDFTITVLASESTTPAQPQQPADPEPTTPSAEVKTANPTNDKLEVNGTTAAPTVYKIGSSNYFKIRDVAALLNGTEKQFDVGYAGGKVTVTSGQAYQGTGKELAGPPAAAKDASPSNDTIVIDGVETSLTVYKIGGSNYFKLRDLGKALNFYVGWEAGRGMYIETGRPYSA